MNEERVRLGYLHLSTDDLLTENARLRGWIDSTEQAAGRLQRERNELLLQRDRMVEIVEESQAANAILQREQEALRARLAEAEELLYEIANGRVGKGAAFAYFVDAKEQQC